jgi:hypothetical protein
MCSCTDTAHPHTLPLKNPQTHPQKENNPPIHIPKPYTNNNHQQAALLFYALMVGNPLFLDSTLARGDVELLFLPLLQQVIYYIIYVSLFIIYISPLTHTQHHHHHNSCTTPTVCGAPASCTSSSSRSSSSRRTGPSTRVLYIYVCVSYIFLHVSVCLYIHLHIYTRIRAHAPSGIFRRILLPTVPWYKERHLAHISLGRSEYMYICIIHLFVCVYMHSLIDTTYLHPYTHTHVPICM